jgi:subtilisin family serine protease
MKKTIITLSLSIFAIGLSNLLYGQVDPKILNWYNGGGTGMQTEKAYKILKDKKSATVIVAVIDSGVDIEHEDLKGKIWINTDEIPGNGIDDDKNGYIDDVNGWNFLGNTKGENVDQATLEKTRLLRELGVKFEGIDPKTISDKDKADYDLYIHVKKDVEEERANMTQYLPRMEQFTKMIKQTPSIVAKKLNKEN